MKNIIRRAAALLICAACVFSFASCTDGNLDKDKDGVFGEEGKNGTDNIIGDGGVDDKANGGTAAAPDLGDMTDDDRTDNDNNNDNNNNSGNGNGGILDPDDDVNGGMTNNGNGGGNGGILDPDDDVNGGMTNGGNGGGSGGILDPDDDVNGGMTNGGNSGGNGGGNSVDPKLGIDTDGTQPSANGSN